MTVEVTITHPTKKGLSTTLLPGQELVFGRAVGGAGRISEDRAVSGKHGIVHATHEGFTVTSIGSFMGFVIADRTTPSRLVIPRGTGPIAIPFADCSIIVEHERGRDHLNLTVTGSTAADQWSQSWGPEIRNHWANLQPAALETLPPWQQWHKSNGKPYAWFATLVALCESSLGAAVAGTPTNGQLAHRLFLTRSAIERHIGLIYKAFGLDGDERQREVIVSIAIDQGIVTSADLRVLPER